MLLVVVTGVIDFGAGAGSDVLDADGGRQLRAIAPETGVSVEASHDAEGRPLR